MARARGDAGGFLPGAVQTFGDLTTNVGNFSATLGIATKALGPIAAAAGEVAKSLVELGNAVSKFVGALNPALIDIFQQAIRNLNATIGFAFEGLIRTAITLTRTIADTLAPTLDGLKPIIDALATAFVRGLLPFVRLLADAVDLVAGLMKEFFGILDSAVIITAAFTEIQRALVMALGALVNLLMAVLRPILTVLIGSLRVLAELISGTAALFKTLVAVLVGLLEAFFKLLGLPDIGAETAEMFDMFIASLRQATRAIILFTAQMLKTFGAESALRRLQEAFAPTRGGTRKVAAPREFGIVGIEELMREQLLAAAQAGVGGAPKPVEDILGDIGKDIKDIAEGKTTLEKLVQVTQKDLDVMESIADWIFRTGAGLTPLVPSWLRIGRGPT
jgi:hypothetical protein